MSAQKAQLSRIKEQPHSAPSISRQFSHGISSHLPDGVTAKLDPTEYWKDEETGLVHHRLSHVSDQDFQKLVKVTRRNAKSVVAYNMQQITGYRGVEPPMVIELDTEKPIFQPPRRNYSPAELKIIDEKADELQEAGVVHEIKHSQYACNPVLAAKRAPDGSWSDKRFCVNYIPINKHTTLDRYGCHRAEELFQRVSNKKFLTALDLRSGFHQILMDIADICKTAFWHVSARNQPPRLLAYTRMPFGLKNASAKFQRVMDAELQNAGCTDFAFAYIDDLLIASDTWEEHVEHVDRILKMLESCNLRIHPDKSIFGTNLVEYLGHNLVAGHGVTMNEAKIEAIKALPTPTNLVELRSILGFLAYYRHFIPGYSSLSAALTKLLAKNQPYDWGKEQEQSYKTLKKLMADPGRVLRPIDPNKELILHTDWSNHGIGAVLGQLDDEGNEYLCACASRSLNKHEREYPSYKGELLALTWAVRSFRQHLHGTNFKLVTDHQPLLWIMKARDLTGQYARWQMMLQEHDFEIVHRPGLKHNNADTLSRFPQPSSEDNTGARLDHDVMLMTIHRHIDDFCPRFGDLLNSGHAYLDRDNYTIPQQERETLFDSLAPVVTEVVKDAKDRIRQAVPEAVLQLAENIKSQSAAEALDQRIVAPSFFTTATERGITLVELCAGIATGIEAVLHAGIKVNRYIYVDIDPTARQVAQFRLANLTARFPHLFPPEAWVDAFTLPQDLNSITSKHMDQVLGPHSQQVLVIAGWPCQEYSPAGKGKIGKRAALLDRVLSIIRHICHRFPEHPVAYILENVTMQDNFRHPHIRSEVAHDLFRKIGHPTKFNATDVGSYASRLRNYWTNLSAQPILQSIYDEFRCRHTGDLYDILQPGRDPMPVLKSDRGGHNVPGLTRRVLPTLMAYHRSRAFRAQRAGSLYEQASGDYTEPMAVERELAMGFEPSSTAAPDVTDAERCALIGQAMDLNALFSLLQITAELSRHGLAIHGASIKSPEAPQVVLTILPTEDPADPLEGSATSRHDFQPVTDGQRTDVWEDESILQYLRHQKLPAHASDSKRVRRRAAHYHWYNSRLFRRIHGKREGEQTFRIIPKPDERDDLILTQHKALGHIGEKRLYSALSTTYWWYGMTLDINRVLSGCKLCRREQASGGHKHRDMQTLPPGEYGMFHRWGIDYAVDLPSSAAGNCNALIMIDYYSKWIEVVPTQHKDAVTTANAFFLNVIARFGVPAEVISDNGGEFKAEFHALCERFHIHHRFITPEVPWSNGLAERAVKTIKASLKKHAAEQHNARTWDT